MYQSEGTVSDLSIGTIVKSASVSGAAIPLAFGYAILRHRLFALDAHLRRFIVHISAAVALVAIFVPTWLILRDLTLNDPLATVAAVAVVGLVAPMIFDRTERLLDGWSDEVCSFR